MRKKQFLILLLVCGFLLLFVHCKKKCESNLLDDKYFTASDLAIVPYTGNETLVFKNINGDSICFYGEGRSSAMIPRAANPDNSYECIGDRRNAESNKTLFKCGNTDSTISIVLLYSNPFYDYKLNKNVYFHYLCDGHYLFNGHYYFYSDTIVSTPQGDYFVSAYYNTLTLINKTYYHVYELDYQNNSHGIKLYYNITQGIVGYKEPSDTIWYLDKKY